MMQSLKYSCYFEKYTLLDLPKQSKCDVSVFDSLTSMGVFADENILY